MVIGLQIWSMMVIYDMIVLQVQVKNFLAASKETSADVNQQYTEITFTSTQVYQFVLVFHTWLRKFGNSQPECKKNIKNL
jgi:pheophorbide a oxygenase